MMLIKEYFNENIFETIFQRVSKKIQKEFQDLTYFKYTIVYYLVIVQFFNWH